MSEPVDQHGSRLQASPREAVRQLAGEIATLREELAGLVAELDRRRHEALDVKLQVKRHVVEMALTAAALVAAATGFVWLKAWRSRRREDLLSRGAKLRRALSGILDKPDRVAAEASVAAKILAATSSAAAATLAKKALDRGLEVALSWKRGGPPRLLRSLVGRGNGADRRGAIARFRSG